MSSAAEFCVFLVGTDVLANRALHRHLRRQYTVHCVGRALQETYQFDKLVFISDKMAEVCNKLAVHAVKAVGDCVAMQRQDTLLVADSGDNRVRLWPLATDESR
jgi:hypothetical protein